MISKNQIKHIRSLHLKKYREEEQCFIAEGVKVVNEVLLHNSDNIIELFCVKDYAERQNLLLSRKVKHSVVTADELKKISAMNTPHEVLAVCSYFKETKIT